MFTFTFLLILSPKKNVEKAEVLVFLFFRCPLSRVILDSLTKSLLLRLGPVVCRFCFVSSLPACHSLYGKGNKKCGKERKEVCNKNVMKISNEFLEKKEKLSFVFDSFFLNFHSLSAVMIKKNITKNPKLN